MALNTPGMGMPWGQPFTQYWQLVQGMLGRLARASRAWATTACSWAERGLNSFMVARFCSICSKVDMPELSLIHILVVAVILAKKKGYKGTPGKFSWATLGKATLQALPSLSLIVVVIGGIVAGVFSATEGSAIAVVYSLILGICYRNITWKSFWNIVVESAKMSGMVVFLIGVSNILGWVMAFLQIPQAVSTVLLGITDNPIIILLIMNLILLIAGTFMDVTPAILIFTPLFLPIVQTFGMDPIHFGLVLVYNLCIGNITPPVGNTLFVAIKVGRSTLAKTMPYICLLYTSRCV